MTDEAGFLLYFHVQQIVWYSHLIYRMYLKFLDRFQDITTKNFI